MGTNARQVTDLPEPSPVTTSPRYEFPKRFESIGEVGRGGWGIVEKAVDRQLEREVAVKRFADANDATEQERQRFLNEAKVTSQLQHPGIVPVHEMGDRQDTFYVMKLLEGVTLSETIERHHAGQSNRKPTRFQFGESLEPLLQRFVDISHAVAYAHQRGVVHRDLKPSNVMVSGFGETVVLDWGLAQSADAPASSLIDPDGTVVGTPAYMSPEQAAGNISKINQASDIYSLGTILYTVIAGRHPYHGQSTDQILRQVKAAAYPSLRSIQPLTPLPLVAIVEKAMAANPKDRYDSAELLANDVRRFIAGDAVSVHHENTLERATRWCRHHQGVAASVAICATILLLSSIAFGAVIKQAHRAERIARIEAQQAHRETIRSLAEARDATDLLLMERSGSPQFYPEMTKLRRDLFDQTLTSDDQLRWTSWMLQPSAFHPDQGNHESGSRFLEIAQDLHAQTAGAKLTERQNRLRAQLKQQLRLQSEQTTESSATTGLISTINTAD